jgi:hypothetical protein
MATPVERLVIEAARSYLAEPGVHEGTPGRGKLAQALRALDASERPTEGTQKQIPLTWGQLVTTDVMLSERTGKWFEVLECKTSKGQTSILLRGGARFTKPADTPVIVRRSEMGEAVDMFASVLWSGPS